jgi:hypothetical protein
MSRSRQRPFLTVPQAGELRRHGVLFGDALQRPEPLVRLAPESFEYQRHGSRPHANDLLIWPEHRHLGRPALLAPGGLR